MKTLLSLISVCLGLGLLCRAPLCAGPEDVAEPPIQDNVERLLTAVRDDDLVTFILDSTPEFAAFTQAAMTASSERYGVHFKMGYDLTYLAELKQDGFRVFFWKLVPKDGSDDMLVRLTMQGNEVAGFHFF